MAPEVASISSISSISSSSEAQMAPEVASSWAATRESPSLRDLETNETNDSPLLRDLAAAASAQLQALGQEFQLRAEALGDLEARAFALDAQRRAMEAWAAHVEMMLAQAPRSAEKTS